MRFVDGLCILLNKTLLRKRIKAPANANEGRQSYIVLTRKPTKKGNLKMEGVLVAVFLASEQDIIVDLNDLVKVEVVSSKIF